MSPQSLVKISGTDVFWNLRFFGFWQGSRQHFLIEHTRISTVKHMNIHMNMHEVE